MLLRTQRESLSILAGVLRAEKMVTMRAVTYLMFALVDSRPTGITVGAACEQLNAGRAVTTTTNKVFRKWELSVQTDTEGKGPHFTATDKLVNVARGYTQLLLDLITYHLPDLNAETIIDRAIRNQARSFGLPDNLPLPSIAERISRTERTHPQGILFRALGGFAFECNVWPPIEAEMHRYIREAEPAPAPQAMPAEASVNLPAVASPEARPG
jgi:hypothetical protein